VPTPVVRSKSIKSSSCANIIHGFPSVVCALNALLSSIKDVQVQQCFAPGFALFPSKNADGLLGLPQDSDEFAIMVAHYKREIAMLEDQLKHLRSVHHEAALKLVIEGAEIQVRASCPWSLCPFDLSRSP
jgi:hypothetical protein